jgi:hypothetical protein
MIGQPFFKLSSIGFNVRVEALPVPQVTEIQVVVAGRTFAQRNEVLLVQFQLRVEMEWLFVMDLYH